VCLAVGLSAGQAQEESALDAFSNARQNRTVINSTTQSTGSSLSLSADGAAGAVGIWMPLPPAPKVSGVATKVTAKKRKPRPKQLENDGAKQAAKVVRTEVQSSRSVSRREEYVTADADVFVAEKDDTKSNPLAALGSYGDSDSE